LKRLGKYEVLAELGHGAMGVVYRARDPIINRLVAVKTITTGLASDPALLQRFYREAQSAGGLHHPNIVTIFDMGEQDGLPYIAMQLIEGENLEQIISRRAVLPISLKLAYAMQACRAFDYAHQRGIVHRDIKPGNMMVDKDGTIKIVDFGIARVVEASKTLTGVLIGTFAYMSPEQYHGEHADKRSDIWSFGVLLYELLSYQKPFSGTIPATLMHSICIREPAPLTKLLPECPRELERIVSKALKKSPDDRYQTMEELLLDLEPLWKTLQAESVADLIDRSRRFVEQNKFPEARDFLCQALQVDSTNQKVRTMLDRVNGELKRIHIRPKVQQQVEKARALLREGKTQDAHIVLEDVLLIDPTFEPALVLMGRVQQELLQNQMVNGWLDSARHYIAEGLPDEAEAELAKVLKADSGNEQAASLRQQVAKEKAERQKRLRLLESLQTARDLWTRQQYNECIRLLADLKKEFPDDEEISRLLETVREDQVELKQQGLLDCRRMLAARRYEDCQTLLAGLREQFPDDEEISQLAERVRKEQADHRRRQGLAEARGFLSAERYDEGVSLLATLSREFPEDHAIGELLDAARESQKEQSRKQGLAKARELLAARRHGECTSLLMTLKKRFPADDEIQKLLFAVRDDQLEQRKREGLVQARNLLASRNYDESIAVLQGLQHDFPAETVIVKLLETARGDRAEQQKQQKLSDARARVTAQSFGEAIQLLEDLAGTYPRDAAVIKLLALAQRGQERQSRNERIKREGEALKKLMNEKNYVEVISRARHLLTEFPGESNFQRLAEFASQQQEQLEKDLSLRNILDDAKRLFAANRFDDALRAAQDGLKAFPAHPELVSLSQRAEEQQKKAVVRRSIEERIRDIRVKINREELSEAIQIAQHTLVTLGPDTDVSQLLNSAKVELEAREKKREQGRVLQEIRTLLESGDLDAANKALDQAIETSTVEAFDPRVQQLSQQIKNPEQPKTPKGAPPVPSLPANISREYALPIGPAPPLAPDSKPESPLRPLPTSQGAAAKPAFSPQPAAPTPSPERISRPFLPKPASPSTAPESVAPPAIPAQAADPQTAPRAISPSEALPLLSPSSTVSVWRKPGAWTITGVVALTLTLGFWGIRHSLPGNTQLVATTTETNAPAPPSPAVLEEQERNALADAGKLIESDNLDAAREVLAQAAVLNGPLHADIESKIASIDQSLSDPNLRQLRLREEKLWQKALKRLEEKHYNDAQSALRQILSLPQGGLHHDDAKTYLSEIIPEAVAESGLFAQAHLDADQGNFKLARDEAKELSQKGKDVSQLLAYIDGQEDTKFARLQAEFNQLQQRDSDDAVQRLNNLWPEFENLSEANGPHAGDAVDYMNRIPEAMQDIQSHMQAKAADASFQRMVQSYQQAIKTNDKGQLNAARNDFQSIVQGAGPHAEEAQKYLADVNEKLDALSKRVIDPGVQDALLRYSKALERRDADALLLVWPNVITQLAGYQTWFAKLSAIRVSVNVESVTFENNGTAAVAKAQVVRDQTPIGATTKRDSSTQMFHLAKQPDRTWLITEIEVH
jgi:eukaryotic-like serine/threonine-protein kinase